MGIRAGVYTVVAMVSGCTESVSELNVGMSGANLRPVRMWVVPPPGVAVPRQEWAACSVTTGR